MMRPYYNDHKKVSIGRLFQKKKVKDLIDYFNLKYKKKH